MTTKYFLSIISLCFVASVARAQQTTNKDGAYRYNDAQQVWQNSNNAAALTLDSITNRGVAVVSGSYNRNEFKRTQEPARTNNLEIFTEKYQTIGKYLVGYGSFTFGMQHHRDRTFKDVILPYNANPFIVGSDAIGKYDLQTIDLKAKLATKLNAKVNYGLTIDYNIADFSRLKDPRSRSSVLNYAITPALVFAINKHSNIGLSGYYNRRKEKIANVSTVNSNTSLMYYNLTGLEHGTATINGFNAFSREWVMHRFGANAQYNNNSQRTKSLNAIGISRGNEAVLGIYKFEPGRYVEYNYNAMSQNRFIAQHFIHQLNAEVNYREGYADEYRQQLNQENDAQTGVTSYFYTNGFTYKKRYRVKDFNANIHYRLNGTNNNKEIIYYVGAKANYNNWQTKYTLPSSLQQNAHIGASVEGGASFLKNNCLWIEVFVGAIYNVKKQLDLNDATTTYAREVIAKDQTFFATNAFSLGASAKYNFNIRIKKQQMPFFAKLATQYTHANSHLHNNNISLTLGLYY